MNALLSRIKTLRFVVAAGVVGYLLTAAQSRDSSVDLTRTVLMGMLHGGGISASDTGEALVVGRLTVPWTSDCSGVNLLAMLLALAVWVNRSAKADLSYWLRIVSVFPAALCANVLRVLTLIGYRELFYPAVESPQLHYFIGFIWLVPMVLFITPRDGRRFTVRGLETLHAAAVLAWLSPIASGPGGACIAASAVILLAQCRLIMDGLRGRGVLTVGWLIGGILIGLFSFESLWLCWLLICPLLWSWKLMRSPAAWLLVISTHPLLAMQSWGQCVAAIGIARLLWQNVAPVNGDAPSSRLVWPWRVALPVVSLALCLPFTASAIFANHHSPLLPPPGLVISDIGASGYELRLPDQPADIRLVWYAAQNNDRHHTVKVCLKYRGKTLTEAPGAHSVFTDGQHWLREFFIQGEQLHASYGDYARSTLAPRSHPGAHVIFVIDKGLMSPAEFDQQTQSLARELLKEHQTQAPIVAAAP